MTGAAAGDDDGFDAIAAGMLADEFRASEEQRTFDRMRDDHIDGVTYTDDGRLFEPMENTPGPGSAEGFLAEERARAIYTGETLPALDLELQRIVDLNARDYPTSVMEIRAPGKHASDGPRHRAASSGQDRGHDVGR